MKFFVICNDENGRKNDHSEDTDTHEDNDTIVALNERSETEELTDKFLEIFSVLFKMIKLVHYSCKIYHYLKSMIITIEK